MPWICIQIASPGALDIHNLALNCLKNKIVYKMHFNHFFQLLQNSVVMSVDGDLSKIETAHRSQTHLL